MASLLPLLMLLAALVPHRVKEDNWDNWKLDASVTYVSFTKLSQWTPILLVKNIMRWQTILRRRKQERLCIFIFELENAPSQPQGLDYL